MTKLYNKIWVNGCFDILHPGHFRMLEYAKSLGNFLAVGIDSDEKVRLNKGPDRPIHSDYDRMMMVSSIKWVDQVVLFNSELGLKEEIRKFNPDCIVDGIEYYGKVVVPNNYKGDILYYPRVESFSTTNILKK